MKRIVNISLASSKDDYEFETRFLDQEFHIQRLATDGDLEKAAEMLLHWHTKADAIGLDSFKFPTLGFSEMMEEEMGKLRELGSQMQVPITAGDALRTVLHEWALRHIQFKFGNNYFDNARVFFFSGVVNSTLANVMAEYTENLTFADPILENGIPAFLRSIGDLKTYATRLHGRLEWIPSRRLSSAMPPLRELNDYRVRQAIRRASIIVVPYYDFDRYMERLTAEELRGKTVITPTAYDDRLEFLRDRGVDVVIDTTPKILDRVVGVSVLEAMIMAALSKPQEEITHHDLLEVISHQRMEPRVVHLSGRPRRVNRFAFVVYPLTEEYLERIETINLLSKVTPPFLMGAMERVAAYSPPFVFSKVTGIESPAGAEAEGWIISLGATPEQMMAHGPSFVRRRLLQAADMAKKLGAQVVGIGTLPKAMERALVDAAHFARVPLTSGNSYVASAALWAAAEAARRLGLMETDGGRILKAKSMVIGATGAVGSICCRLLAKAFGEVYMVGRNMAKLMALQESIQEETPEVSVHLSTSVEKYAGEMDVIVAATSGARGNLDIMKVKPGCIITDVTRPMIFTPEEVAKRPDVLVIKSGELQAPGENFQMKDIGLPPRVVYAAFAETLLLALEGRYEGFTVGSEPEWDKVREIYRLGLKHGMKLAAISGVRGVISDDDIARVKKLALEAREEAQQARNRKAGTLDPVNGTHAEGLRVS